MSKLRSLPRGWPLWLLLAGCQPAQITLVRAPADNAALPPVASAPAVPLSQVLALDAYVRDQIENYIDKRAERLGGALEPEELVHELRAQTRSVRLKKDRSVLESHLVAGEELFEFEFGPGEGLGDGIGGKPPNMHRVHRGARGGPDTTSCRSCHHRGGDDGAGEYQEAALTGGDGLDPFHSHERNAPSLLGIGAVQILAAEISAKLATQVAPVLGQTFTRDLEHQGVSFGSITVRADGTLDTSRLTALDPDLIVRPFGWKGTHATLRRFAEEAFQVHHGMQSEVLVQKKQLFGPLPRGTSAATAGLLKVLGDGPPGDPDRDGRIYELEGPHLTSMAVYLATLPLPTIDPPRSPQLQAAWHSGERIFREVGCADCHKPFWLLESPLWKEHGETAYHQDEVALDLRKDIQRGPKLGTIDTELNGYPIYLFSDLRRHDMGAALADVSMDDYPDPPRMGAGVGRAAKVPEKRAKKGPLLPDAATAPIIAASSFLTRPLWGLADTAPYLHDGRAQTIPEAILWHGGEAAATRDRYRKLDPAAQRALHVFLLSLTRAPVPEVVP